MSAHGRSGMQTLRASRPQLDVGSWAVIIALLAGLTVAVFGPISLVGALGIVVAGLGVFRWPGLVFAAYLLLPFYKGFIDPHVPGDLTVILALLNGIQIVWVVRGGWRHARREPLILGLALTMVIVAGGAYAPDQTQSLPFVAQWLALIVGPASAALRIVSDARHIRHLIIAIAAFGVLVTLLAVPRLGGAERVVVLEMNTIQVAIVAMFVPMAAFAYARGGARGLALVILTPLSVLVAVASGSRGPLLASATVGLVAASVYLAKSRAIGRRAATLIGLGGVGVAVAFAVAGSLPQASIARYLALVDFISGPAGTADGGSLGARADLIGASLRLFTERPLFGNGTGAFAYHAGGTVGMTDLPYPHNILLHAAADLGLVGLVLVVILVGNALLRKLPPGRRWLATRFVFAFLFVESLVSGDLYSDRMLWGLLFLLVLAPPPRVAEAGSRRIS